MSKKQEVCEQWNFDAMIKAQPSEKAKAWFRRKPYDIKRGDAGGQENVKSVSRIAARDTEVKEGYTEAE